MTGYIEKQTAKEKLCSMCRWEGTSNCDDCEHPIDDIPPADVRPVVRGRWIVHYDDIWPTESTQECSECHEEVPLLIDCKFCPNCTAEMEVDEDG